MHLMAHLKEVVAWLHANPGWAGFAAFNIAFFESLTVIGLFIPGTVLMTALGSLIGAGVLPLREILIWSMVGAALGDAVSFFFGIHFHEHIKRMWPLKRYPQLVKRGEDFFHRHGGKSLFFGRFAGPLRAVVPSIAGMLNFPTKRFIVVDIFSAIVWAPVYLFPGFLIGAASVELAPEAAARLLLTIMLTLASIWIGLWLVKRFLALLHRIWDKVVKGFWRNLNKHPSWQLLANHLHDPSKPHDHRQLKHMFTLVLLLTGFVALALTISQHSVLTNWNEAINYFFLSLRHPNVDRVIVAITLFADAPVVAGITAIIFIFLIFQRKFRAAIYWAANSAVAVISVAAIKYLINYPRPAGLNAVRNSPSFPSSHTSLSIAVFGFLAVLLASSMPKYKKAIYRTAAIFIGTIVFTRLYLGAHWFTDIIGGCLLGFTSLLFFVFAYRRKAVAVIPFRAFMTTALTSLLLCGSIFAVLEYSKDLHDYTPSFPIGKITRHAWWHQSEPLLPLYVENRIGRRIAILNFQVQGEITKLESLLRSKHWKIVKSKLVGRSLAQYVQRTNIYHMPLLPQLFHNKKPLLVLAKPYHKQHLLLRIWHSSKQFPNHNDLFVGTLVYQVPKHHWLTKTKLPVRISQNDAINVVYKDLKHLPSRRILIKNTQPIIANLDKKHAQILLLKV